MTEHKNTSLKLNKGSFKKDEQQKKTNLKSAGIKLISKKQPNTFRYFIGAYFKVSLTIFLSLYT